MKATVQEPKTTTSPTVSFELFPPKSDDAREKLQKVIHKLAALSPSYFSVTCGALGSKREGTEDVVLHILNETNIPPAAHLTCSGVSKAEIETVAKEYWNAGIHRIVALRGDIPESVGAYQPHPEGYAYADSLVKGLLEIADFDISVAAYPETHPEAQSSQADLEHLKRKIDAGANRAITQYCFDTDKILRFVDEVNALGVDAPIIPGILPVHNIEQVVSFSKRCGASVPQWLQEKFAKAEGNAEAQFEIAVTVALEQCQTLQAAGINSFHFYTLNRSALTIAVCNELGIGLQEKTL